MTNYDVDTQNSPKSDSPNHNNQILHDQNIPSDQTALVALKTILELRTEKSLLNFYVVKVPVRFANKALHWLRGVNNNASRIDIQHLRRFAREEDLPQHLGPAYLDPTEDGAQSCSRPAYLYLLVAPTSSIDLSELRQSLVTLLQKSETDEVAVLSVQVPSLAPTSHEQALAWSRSYWPTVYKKSNPFGPHPSLISRAENDINSDLHIWMGKAVQVASRSKTEGYGEAIGAVVVDRRRQGCNIIALAADCRWMIDREDDENGNAMAHAALRAIGMVARRLNDAQQTQSDKQNSSIRSTRETDIFIDSPVFPEERVVFESGSVSADGYLCHGFEIYLTHEPCVMCSMALLHSRFARVVFGKRMPRTGGLCSGAPSCGPALGQSSLGYGLFWRKELNWCFLAWQSKSPELDLLPLICPFVQV